MHLPPTLPYNGLTVILSNPSRKDTDNSYLLSGNAGIYFDECLKTHGLSRQACDIRVCDTNLPLRDSTRCLLVLGENAMHVTCPEYNNYFLGEQRGYPLRSASGHYCIASFLPQDCMDVVDYESRLNPLAGAGSGEDEGDGLADEKQHHGRTSRSNYRFWLRNDIRRVATLLRQPYGQLPFNAIHERPIFRIYPKAEEAIAVLENTKSSYMDFDIEVDSALNISVFSFSFDDSPIIWCIPCIRYNYSCAYNVSLLARIFRGLAVAMRDNITVCHNGWAFDLFVLAWKYRMPIGENHYDTLLAQHRIFVEPEKSLGHAMSIWTWLPFHKDTASFSFHNQEQEQKHWQYNANDVWGMKLVRIAQQNYAVKDKGLVASIEQANEMVRPYLLSTLQGIRYDAALALSIRQENDRYMAQYIRMLSILAGKAILPTSPKQVTTYFHTDLGYKVVGRSLKGNPNLDEKNMLKLKLKYPDNKAIDLVLAYRQKSKESGTLKITPWRQLHEHNKNQIN